MAGYHYEFCSRDWDCWQDWFMGQGANTVAGLLGAAATVFVAWLALRFSRREARERRVQAMLTAKLTAAMHSPTVHELWRYSYSLLRHLRAMAPSRHDWDIQKSRDAYAKLLDEVAAPPAMVSLEQIALLAPLGDRVHVDLAISIGTIRHTMNCGEFALSYLQRLEQDRLLPREETHQAYCVGLIDAGSRLRKLSEAFRYIANSPDPDLWKETDEVPVLRRQIKGRFRSWIYSSGLSVKWLPRWWNLKRLLRYYSKWANFKALVQYRWAWLLWKVWRRSS